MFCSKCGKTNEENVKICAFCGNELFAEKETNPTQPEAAAPQPEAAAPQPEAAAPQPEAAATQPEETPVESEAAPKKPKVRKGKFIHKHASKGIKVSNIIMKLLTLVLAAVLISSYFAIPKTPINEIPVMNGVISMNKLEKEVDALYNNLDEALEMVRRTKEDIRTGKELPDDYNIDKEKLAEYEIALDDMEILLTNLSQGISVESLKEAISIWEKHSSLEGFEKIYNISVAEESETIQHYFDLVNYLIIALIALALIWSLFGGFFNNLVLVIIGMFFSVAYAVAFCGFLYGGIVLVIHIAMIVLICLINRAYKKFRIA